MSLPRFSEALTSRAPGLPRALLPVILALLLALPTEPAAAQQPVGDSVTSLGILRASATVDSVYVDRLLPEVTVGSGDFVSYLMARLGIYPIPPDLRLRAAVDGRYILLNGRIADLPAQARAELSPLIGMFGEDALVEAQVTLSRTGPEVVRFHLQSVSVNRMMIPEFVLQSYLTEVGRRYPALTKSGRDLFVQVPADAGMRLVPGGVHLTAPPATPCDTAGCR